MRSALSRHIYTDPAFYRGLLAITLPIALQNIISLGVNMMDTVMLGQLGDVAIAAANLGGQPFMILNILGFGLASGASVLIAQYWGRRDMVRIRQLFTITLRCAFAASVLFCIGCLLFPQPIPRSTPARRRSSLPARNISRCWHSAFCPIPSPTATLCACAQSSRSGSAWWYMAPASLSTSSSTGALSSEIWAVRHWGCGAPRSAL